MQKDGGWRFLVLAGERDRWEVLHMRGLRGETGMVCQWTPTRRLNGSILLGRQSVFLITFSISHVDTLGLLRSFPGPELLSWNLGV